MLKKAKTKNGLEEIKEEYNNETLDEPEAKHSASSDGKIMEMDEHQQAQENQRNEQSSARPNPEQKEKEDPLTEAKIEGASLAELKILKKKLAQEKKEGEERLAQAKARRQRLLERKEELLAER